MITHPRPGQPVRIHYRRSFAWLPLQDKVGVVRVVARGPGPRNHGVEVDGRTYAVPCGNLVKVKEEER